MSLLARSMLTTSMRCQRSAILRSATQRTFASTANTKTNPRLPSPSKELDKNAITSAKKTNATASDSPAQILAQRSWLTRQVEASPLALKVFLGLAKALGYGSTKQIAARRAFWIYKDICATAPDIDPKFWKESCHLPPTFQSWFTVTNLHIWLLTVRLRALPAPHGSVYIQALIDHFFLDIEDRIRDVLQPKEVPSQPYTFRSDFYQNPNERAQFPSSDDSVSDSKKKPGKGPLRSRAPDRLVTRQMKIFKEQWTGMGMALDLALVQGDADMAATAWRNLLGARGARGIALPSSSSTSPEQAGFRRSVNLVGGEVVDVSKVDVDKEETIDDGSGVHDFKASESDRYIAYPETMQDIVRYIQRELVRLDSINDDEIIQGDGLNRLVCGRVRGG